MHISAIIDHVYDALEQFGSTCSMEEVVGLCPELTWNQVYLAIDFLDKAGKISVIPDPNRTYTVQVRPSATQAPQFSARISHARSAA
jgi:hypothetical protein